MVLVLCIVYTPQKVHLVVGSVLVCFEMLNASGKHVGAGESVVTDRYTR